MFGVDESGVAFICVWRTMDGLDGMIVSRCACC